MRDWKLKRALIVIFSGVVLTLVLGVGGFWIWINYRNDKLTNEKYKITAIIQTGPEKEALKTAYLAEILGLSIDKPSQLYAFDLKEGEKKLKASPLISKVEIQRLPPSTLYIDYEVRKPVAYLADFKNRGIDEAGHIFPITPFFSPKNLPEIYLGIEEYSEQPINSPHFYLALDILKYLETAPWEEGLHVLKIDVSNAFQPSLGQREVVLTTEEEVSVWKEEGSIVCLFPKIIRLSPKDYKEQLLNFFKLQKTMMDDYRRQIGTLNKGGRFAPRIVDLRIPQLAFVEK